MGRYIAEFLAQSAICDEVGILLADGGDWCLGDLPRPFDQAVQRRRDCIAERALAGVRGAARARHPSRAGRASRAPPRRQSPGASPRRQPTIPAGLWPELSTRERELVQLMLAGHPTATIAERLGITVGTVKNHRRRIYEKLDITTERELFLQFFNHRMAGD